VSNESYVSERVKDLLAAVCDLPVAEIRDDGELLSYGLDSVRAMEFILRLEEAFDIEVSEFEAAQFETVGDAATYVRDKVS
jgi:acyl carrier protein